MGVSKDISMLEKSIKEMQLRGEEDKELIGIFKAYLVYLRKYGYSEFFLNNNLDSQGNVNGFVRNLDENDLKEIERISKLENYGYKE